MSSDPARWQAAPYLRWPLSVEHAEAKWAAAQQLAKRVQDGDAIGIGSGSSAYLSLRAIAERARTDGLFIRLAVCSQETEIAATTLGLPLVRLGHEALSWIVDGADEVDSGGRFLKGRGGALFKEKILWSSCERRYVVIDRSKHVERLGTRFPVPIEVHPNAVEHVARMLQHLGCVDAALRVGTGKDGPVFSESGFLLLDARFPEIPPGLHSQIKQLPGVLETGIFEGYRAEIVQGNNS